MSITFIEFLNQSGRCESPLPILVKATKKAEVEHIMNNTGWSKSIVMSLQKEFNAFKTVNLSESEIKDDVVLIPHYMATEYNAVAFHDDGVNVHIALANPSEYETIEQISLAIQRPVLPFLALVDDINIIRKALYTNTAEIESYSEKSAEQKTHLIELNSNEFHQLNTHMNLDKLVHHIISEGIKLDATDIHIEKNYDQFFLQYRVMKMLSDPIELDAQSAFALRQKLILMSNGLITNTHKPQDLSFSFDTNKSTFCRLSILPTVGGYSMVIRLFKELNENFFMIDYLVPDKSAQYQLKLLSQINSSMVIFSGPVNSGKTTLLYSSLIQQKNLKKTIISIEDPVEVRIQGINQIEISEHIDGLDYSSIIKSSARQNPDVVSFGEIREPSVANLAINTASTGILSYATIHASSCVQAIFRLMDMDIKKHMIVNTLRQVFSQRLFKRLCPKCSQPYQPTTEELKIISPYLPSNKKHDFSIKKGCSLCQFTGYAGLVTIVEDLKLSTNLKILLQEDDMKSFLKDAKQIMKTSSLPYRAIQSGLNHTIDFNDIINLIINYEI